MRRRRAPSWSRIARMEAASHESYNPWTVVNLVFHHLAEQGLHPTFSEAGDPGEHGRAAAARAGHPATGGGQPAGVREHQGRAGPDPGGHVRRGLSQWSRESVVDAWVSPSTAAPRCRTRGSCGKWWLGTCPGGGRLRRGCPSAPRSPAMIASHSMDSSGVSTRRLVAWTSVGRSPGVNHPGSPVCHHLADHL